VADYAPGAATVRSNDQAFSIKLAWHENLLNASRLYRNQTRRNVAKL